MSKEDTEDMRAKVLHCITTMVTSLGDTSPEAKQIFRDELEKLGLTDDELIVCLLDAIKTVVENVLTMSNHRHPTYGAMYQ